MLKTGLKLLFIGLILIPITINYSGCNRIGDHSRSQQVKSPNGINRVVFELVDGIPYYTIAYGDKEVLDQSRLGIVLKSVPDFSQGLKVMNTVRNKFDEIWEQPWGEQRLIRNSYNELAIELTTDEKPARNVNIIFRAFDDGVAFRYEFPRQANLGDFIIMDELTEFALPGDHRAWWIGAYQWNRYEYLFENTPVSQVDTAHTPFTMATADGLFLSIHEAALTDYASMTLANAGNHILKCDLVPWAEGDKVRAATPHVSPWRMIMIAKTAGELITNYMALNLNEPSRIEDVSLIKPGKYVGIWWGMHIGKYTWGSGEKHGATTANVKKYIDFAAGHGFDGVLVEGWNTGWDGDWVANGNLFSFTATHPDFDLPQLSAYAAEKSVQLIGHHETSKGIGNYEAQLEAAFELCRKHGIKTVKTGYVGHGRNIIRYEEGRPTEHREWHHGQYMVNHYRKVTETAARYGIMLDVHEPIKDTGIRRTWPNLMTREGARGQEFNAWGPDGGNPPDYTTIIPFTRCLSGPFDFTPGIFDLFFEEADRPDNRINTTLVKQLALYVTIYSPLHMAADLSENYAGHPAFKFIEDVPVDWEETRVLNAEIGGYLTIVRKDRNSDDWYLGSITNENGRSLELGLDFLDSTRRYRAEIYADATDADWQSNPYAYSISDRNVSSTDKLKIDLAPGGGQVIRFVVLDR
ncbi:MAG: glycoside hydrolase family 97 protein [Candidatus Neomarinimicrobiota bacterium]